MSVRFEDDLHEVLPHDLPQREHTIRIAARHLEKIAEANEYMNLTRITSAREAAVKHVFDSVAPWRLFAGEERVLDAGTGAGFPGIPLAAVLPGTRFTLAESIGKKARFLDAVADELALPNVAVLCERAESVAVAQQSKLVTARAVAPLEKLVDLFRKPLAKGARLLLYKGPDVESEMHSAASREIALRVVERYELPHGMGTRSMVEVRARQARSA